jgi:hypothetical protein
MSLLLIWFAHLRDAAVPNFYVMIKGGAMRKKIVTPTKSFSIFLLPNQKSALVYIFLRTEM